MPAGTIVPGINRYIVGCKLIMNNEFQVMRKRINRYIVGCKFAKQATMFYSVFELIDT